MANTGGMPLMRKSRRLAIRCAAAFLIAAIPATLFAQWPTYTTANVPKLPDGKPNLDGPAPRTAEGKPDLTGLWQFVDSNPRLRPPGAAGVLATAAEAKSGKRPAVDANGLPRGFRSQFWDIGSTIPGGLPYTPWGAALRKQRMENNNKDNPDAHCLPMGLMQFHTHPQPRKMIQTKDEIVMIYEANYGLRQIFLDGRTLPKADDVEPWWYGYSVGHWDGDTLVVETTGFRDDVWLDVQGSPLTSTGKMIERYRRPNYGHLEIDITVEDPKAYTKPWTVRVNQRIMLNTNLIEFICNENERSDAHLVGK
ncbi:MAG TPA: hypothetical protein VMH80_02180 [Bryobacteraceae bacterium]|nr:hypothetical protein [Bryobacteraceae bacterium]